MRKTPRHLQRSWWPRATDFSSIWIRSTYHTPIDINEHCLIWHTQRFCVWISCSIRKYLPKGFRKGVHLSPVLEHTSYHSHTTHIWKHSSRQKPRTHTKQVWIYSTNLSQYHRSLYQRKIFQTVMVSGATYAQLWKRGMLSSTCPFQNIFVINQSKELSTKSNTMYEHNKQCVDILTHTIIGFSKNSHKGTPQLACEDRVWVYFVSSKSSLCSAYIPPCSMQYRVILVRLPLAESMPRMIDPFRPIGNEKCSHGILYSWVILT